ncbi:MAG: futalosine hydrolase [Prevotellaceae bacterium]|jgi:futalosine hydrolase|nr:futalosine hydrolase [Prevotellaceae bacterium]
MKILITAATKSELSALKQQLNCVGNSAIVNHNSIYLAVTDVGITATAYNLTKQLQTNTYDLVLNTGIAGSFSEQINVGETVVVEREVFADWGIDMPEGFLTVFDENIVPRGILPFNSVGELYCRHIAPYPFLRRFRIVKGATVNAGSSEALRIGKLKAKFAPDIESMEGAAFFYVCLMENIPFIEMRCISNIVEKRDKSQWNIPLAINNLSDSVSFFLASLQ